MLHLVQNSVILVASIVCVFSQSQTSTNFFYISAKGDELWAIDRQYQVNRYVKDTWQPLTNGLDHPFKAMRLGASPDGWSYMCSARGLVYRWNAGSNSWEDIGVLGEGHIHVTAKSKDTALTTDVDNIYKITDSGMHWMDLTPDRVYYDTGMTKWVSIGVDGDVWGIDKDGLVFRKNSTTKNWDPQPIINAENLDVQSADKVVVTSKCCKVYVWNGRSWIKWKISGCPKQATIGNDKIYYLDEMQNLVSATISSIVAESTSKAEH